MHYRFFVLIITIFLITGCRYEIPLVDTADRPIDPAMLGLWRLIPESGEESGEPEQMMVLAYSDTEYLIHHPIGEDGVYYRAYPIEVAGKACVQLQIIGDEDGPLTQTSEGLYLAADYVLEEGQLEVNIMNTELLSNTYTSSQALRKAFRQLKHHPDLFNNPGTFVRVTD